MKFELSASMVMALAASLAQAATQTWTGSGATPEWTNSANWLSVAVPGGGDDILFNSASTNNLATVLGTNFSINSLTLVSPSGGVSIASDANTNVLTVGAGGIDMSAATTNLTLTSTFSPFVVLGAPQTWNVAAGMLVQANGTIGGTAALTKTGSGAVVLNAGNSFSGGLTINGGAVVAIGSQVNNRLAGNSTVTINNGGTFVIGEVNVCPNTINYVVNPGGVLLLTNYTGAAGFHAHLGSFTLNGGQMLGRATSSYAGEDCFFDANGTVTVGGTNLSYMSLGSGLDISTRTFLVNDATGNTNVDLQIDGRIIGGGSLTKTGAGTLLLTGTNTYSGNTVINNGRLVLAAGSALANSAAVIVNAGAVFDVMDPGVFSYTNKTLLGSGAVSGNVELVGGSVIGGGTAGTAGKLTISGNLIMQGTATNMVDIGGGQNDSIWVGGVLSLNGDTISVNATTPLTNGTYTIVNYPSTFKAGSFSTTVLSNTRKTIAVDETPTDHVDLVVSGGGGSAITWISTTNTAWDIGVSSNWYNTGTAATDVFLQGDSVRFDDTAGVTATIVFAGTMAPGDMAVDSNTNNFSITGGGKISGSAGLTKSGTSTLSLGGNGNDFLGDVVISGGVLVAVSSTSLGATNGVTRISDGATLDVNGQNLGQEVVNITGAGAGGNGAIVNSGADQTLALQYVNLLGDASIGGNNGHRWDVRNGTAPYVNLNGHALTKVGTNYIAFVGATVTNSGDIIVNGGILSLEAGSPIRGTGAIYVNPVGTLQYWNTAGIVTKDTVINGGTLLCGSASTIGSPIVVNTNGVINAAANLTLTNVISGAAGFNKIGAAVLTLPVANTFAGGVVLSVGTLNINTDASLGAVPGAPATNLTFAGGATLQAGANGIALAANRVIAISNVTMTVDPQTNVMTIGGAIVGTGSVSKPSAGQATMAGGANIGGGFFASAGRLVFDGSTFTSSIATNSRSLSLQGGATAIVTNGAQLNFNGTIVLGTGGSGNSGNIIQYSGSIVVRGNEGPGVGYRALQVGEYPLESSTYTMLGGSLSITNGTLYLPWNATQGTWNVSSSTAIVKKIQISTGVGYLNFESGAIIVGADGIVGGNAVLSFGGGTIGAYDSWNSTLGMTLTGTNGPTTFDTAGNTITLTGLLSGTGGLTKAGTGALWLNRTNETYSSPTVVNGGTLAGGGTLASAVSVNNGGTFAVGSPTVPLGSWTMPSLTLNYGATVQLPFNTTNIGLNVTGTNAFTTTSTNAISLAGSIVTGTFPIIDYAGTIQGAGISGLTLLPVTPRGSASLVDNVASTTVDLVISDLGAPVRWIGNLNNQWDISTTTNWQTTTGATPTKYLQNPNGDLVLFDDAASLFSINIPANVSPTFMTVSNNANDYVIGGGGIGGVNGLTKYGTGKLTLNNTNTFSGVVGINNGTLAIAAEGSLGAVPAAAYNQIILSGGSRIEALSTITFSGNRRVLLGPVGAAGTVTIDTGANSLTMPQIIADNAGSTGTLVKTGSGTLNLTINGNTFSGGTIINGGTINIPASGNNLATALGVGRPLTINTGAVLRLAAGDALGWYGGNPNPCTINGGAMTVASNLHDSVGNFGFIMNAGTITSEGAGDVTGNYIFDGPVTTLSNSNPSVINPQKINVRVNPINYYVAAGGGPADLLLSAAMTGNGMIKNGDGIMVLTGTNTYTGGTSINGGTLSVDLIADSVESRIGTAGGAGNFLALGGGTLRFTGTGTNTTTRYLWIDQAAGSFEIAQTNGTLVLSPTGGNVIRGVTKSGPGSLVMNGVIGGTSYVAVTGGKLILNAINTNTGPATVSNGTLIVNGTASNTAVSIAAGGLLGGTGYVGSVVNAGIVSPGQSIGTFYAGSYTQTVPGALNIEIAGTTQGSQYDELLVNGAASLGGTLNVSLTNGFAPAVGNQFIILQASSLGGTRFATTNLPSVGTNVWSVEYVADSFVVLSVTNPPPSGYDAWALSITNGLTNATDSATGDGYPNLLKYATGSSPTQSDTIARMDSAKTNGFFALKFNHNVGATDVTLIVEGSYASTNDAAWNGIATNLHGSWGGATNYSEDTSSTPAAAVVWDTDTTATNRFLRLRVTRP